MLRRDFFKVSVATAALLQTSNLFAQKPKNITIDSKLLKTTVAICGGGFAGLSAAKFLKELNPTLDVTLIEQRSNFMSCPLSNGWLGGVKDITYESLNFDYNSAVNAYGYNFINETIVAINRAEKTIQTNNKEIKYDYMIMCPGVDYNYTKLFKKDTKKAQEALLKAPPGLKPGSEHLALKRMITNFKGGNFILTIPSQAYKCPPAPYERACMIANYFKENKIDGKVIVIDPRRKPGAKPKKFVKAFNEIYPNIIEYRKLTSFKDIDFDKKIISVEYFDTKSMDYKKENIPYEEASIIPPNKANKLVEIANIETYTQGWVKLRQPTFRTVSDEDVYVIGDAQGEYPYPKSGQMAYSCAYIVAKELTARMAKKEFNYKENMPGNVCYSMVTSKKSVSITHSYTLDDKVNVSSVTSKINKATADASRNWYHGLTADIFGL